MGGGVALSLWDRDRGLACGTEMGGAEPCGTRDGGEAELAEGTWWGQRSGGGAELVGQRWGGTVELVGQRMGGVAWLGGTEQNGGEGPELVGPEMGGAELVGPEMGGG